MPFIGHTAIFGGSFNPPHLGHQMACLYLLEGLGADEVWLVPAHLHAFNKPLADYAHRRAMCDLLAGPFNGRVRVDDSEHQETATGRTYDTLQALRQQHPQRRFFLVIGADVLNETAQWYRWSEISAMVPVVVLGRQEYPPPDMVAPLLPDISSNDIRRRVRANESLSGLVPVSIAEYIRQHGLYRSAG